MRIAHELIAFGLKQVLGDVADKAVDFLDHQFTDHAGALPRALGRAQQRAWDALGIALAGDDFVSQIKVFFADGDAKGLREQVRVFLQTNAFDFAGATVVFRKHCLTELKAAHKAGQLSADHLTAAELRQPVADFRRYTEDAGLLAGARAAVAKVAGQLDGDYPHLARLLREPTPAGPPLLAAAFAYFFRREVQTNPELARGLHFELLQQLFAGQGAAFAGIGGAVERLGGKIEAIMDGVREQLDRIEVKVDTVLEELRQFAQRNKVRPGEVASKLTISITNEQELELLKRLRDDYRKLPPEQQNVESLMLLADSLSAAGLCALAQEMHAAAARRAAAEKNGREAEGHYKMYLDSCELGQWQPALAALLEAARLDPARFRPFPLKKYVPLTILGAGGFGTVVKCEDLYAVEGNRHVAVKTLHTADLARDVKKVFAEAHTLSTLKDPGIIGVRYWDFADEEETRPFIVMEYFDGVSLGEYLRRHGKLAPEEVLAIARQVASAMKAAHGANIFHRDLKPDNILVRKTGKGWEVRLIDFGLAVRQQAVGKSVLRPLAVRSATDHSYAGTFKYAPPEQKSEPDPVSGKVEPVGAYSDVYTFGKTFFEALFRTTDPKRWDFDELPAAFQPLAGLLERCTATPISRRPPDFGPVLEALAQLRLEGEVLLAENYGAALARTQGRPTAEDRTALSKLCRDHRIPQEQVNAIIREVKAKWDAAVGKRAIPQPREATPSSKPVSPAVSYTIAEAGITMRLINPGRFWMGSPADEEGHAKDETLHEVVLTKPYYLAAHPVTRGQFRRFVEAGNYRTEAEREGGAYGWTGSKWELDSKFNWKNPGFAQDDDHPVVCVSHNDAVAYCEWLNRVTGQMYGLPTEAQWEYSCRGRALSSGGVVITSDAYHFGKTITPKNANYSDSKIGGTSKVGSYAANGFGLYDMHGNVWEWCADWYGEYSTVPGGETDPQGPSGGSDRVFRGGCWFNGAGLCRAASRDRDTPSDRFRDLGFRLARVPSGKGGK